MNTARTPPLIRDLIDRFERVRHMCDDEKEFVQGVIDFYQARTTTRMNLGMERLALIAAVLLPWDSSWAGCSPGRSAWAGGEAHLQAWTDRTGLSSRPADGTFVLIEA